MAKPVPVIAAEFTVTGEVPVDVRVNDCVVDEFTVTLPKLKLAVLIVSCGLTVPELAATPVPAKPTTAVVLPLDELLTIVS